LGYIDGYITAPILNSTLHELSAKVISISNTFLLQYPNTSTPEVTMSNRKDEEALRASDPAYPKTESNVIGGHKATLSNPSTSLFF